MWPIVFIGLGLGLLVATKSSKGDAFSRNYLMVKRDGDLLKQWIRDNPSSKRYLLFAFDWESNIRGVLQFDSKEETIRYFNDNRKYLDKNFALVVGFDKTGIKI